MKLLTNSKTKRIGAFVLSVLSVLFLLLPSFSAFASVRSPETTASYHQLNAPTVNGNRTNEVSYDIDEKNNKVTFYYNGEDEVSEWTFVDKNGNSYTLDDLKDKLTVISMDGNTLVVSFKDWKYFEAPDGLTLNVQTKSEHSTVPSPTTLFLKDNSVSSAASGSEQDISARAAIIATVVAALSGVVFIVVTKKYD